MQTERSRRFAALALGATAIFDLTGAVIYRVMRSSLPPAPPPPAAGPFRQATRELLSAHREAVSRVSAREPVQEDDDEVSLPA